MQCTACGSDNPDSHRFCGQCGAALVRACPACSFANEPGGKFCGGCGAPLDGQDPPASHAAPDDATPVSGGERRQVSVLFADLSGFTRLSSGLDPEETHALLNRFFAAVDAVVERYGGAVDKHVGDSVMAVFGAPVAHGNDPERAVRAAIDIHQAVAGLTRDNGEALSVHIGVASGQVVASGTGSAAHQEYTVTGDSVNLASRLQDLAAAGQTLISDAVRNAVSADVECEDIGEVEVAGLPKAVRVWRLIGWAGPRTAGKVPLIGRKFELGQFGNALSACAQNGTGQTLYLRGEAGIGKTRLIEDFRTIAQTSGHTCHSVLVLDFGAGRSGDAVRALVRSLLDVPSSGEGAKSRADWAVSSGLVDTERALFLYDLLNLAQPPELSALYQAMDNSARRRGFEEAVAGLVSGLAARGPLLITVEDIQWADSIVLEQLAALAAAVAGCRAVLVLTSRIDGDPLDQAWRAATGGSPLLTFDLAPLRHEEALELAGGYFQASEAFARRCIERAEGNPLFLDQLLRSAEEAGEDDIPGSVQSLVLSRMDRLEAADRQALQAAAVLGPQFSLDALRHILADRAYICRNLIEHILVRPAGDDFLFAHALIRDGAYSSLLKARRRELHGRAAQWFDGRDPVLRAEHLDGAHDAAAPAAYLEAARVHAAQYHFERALHVAERGLALSETADDEYALAILMGEVLHDLGEIAASTEAFESALAVASDNERRCNAWIGLAGGLRIADRFEDALEVLEKAQSAAGEDRDARLLTRIHFLRGNLYFPLGNIDGCLSEHEHARGFARDAGAPADEARALGGLGDAYYLRGRMITAHDHFDRCLEVCQANGFRRTEVAYLPMRGTTYYYQNNKGAAWDDGITAGETAARLGQLRPGIISRWVQIDILADRADWVAAIEACEALLDLSRRLGARRFEPFGLLHIGLAIAALGDRAKGAEMIEQAVAITADTGATFLGPYALGALAATSDDRKIQTRALREGEDLLAKGCVSHNYFSFYRYAMEAALQTGDWPNATRYADALAAYMDQEPLPWGTFFIEKTRALAGFEQAKDDQRAHQALKDARDRAAESGFVEACEKIDKALAS